MDKSLQLLQSRLIIGNYPKNVQYALAMGTVLVAALVCYLSADLIGYRVVALVLLLVVSVLAMVCEIMPVLIAAVLSALIWNFLFIPPELTFRIGNTEDLLLFLMYFVVVILNAVLTTRLRRAERRAQKEEENKRTIALYTTLINSLSHELRTPIATIIGAVDTLKEQPELLTAESKSTLLNEIETASLRLNRHVANLLNMSRLESGFLQLRLDWCDVNELVHSVIQQHALEAERHIVVFKAQEDLPLFKLDRVLIEQVLSNLLHNALQYTPDNSKVEIHAFQKEGSIVIVVADQGKGIPPDEMQAVFEKFHRLPHSIAGGTGLGLSIAKGFTEAHHGTLLLENLPGGGARFSMHIPAEISNIQMQPGEDPYELQKK